MTSYTIYKILLLLVTLQAIRGCLPMDEVFKSNSAWMQAVSVPDRHLITIGLDDEKKIMSVKTERDETVMTYTCLKAHGSHRYMMSRAVPNEVAQFQCIKFMALTPQVVRIASSEPSTSMEKLDCRRTVYKEEAAVLIAYYDIPTQPCPLQGGYQMRLRETAFPEADACADDGWSQNPSIHFECSKNNYVLAQFGRHCVPKVLGHAQKMRRRYLTHLHCVSSWTEEGKGHFLLLQMRDMYTTFWCMNVKPGADEVLSVYLTFDGRCSEKPPESDASSRHGHLIRYVPASDQRCAKPSGECTNFDSAPSCSESNQCPHRCDRCVPEKKSSHCRFMLDTAGRWVKGDGLTVDVDTAAFTMSDQGKFECSGKEERSLPGRVYPVVQHGRHPSCLPFHACSQMLSPVPGLLKFFLRPTATVEGKISTCTETNAMFGGVIPVDQEREFTLVDEAKLEKIACNVMERKTYPSYRPGCNFAVEKCSGKCNTLSVGRDLTTCGNQSSSFDVEMENRHICYARLKFEGGHHGIVTKSVMSESFHCWIFTKNGKLYIAPAWQCNSENVRLLLEYYLDKFNNDPMYALIKPESESKSGSYASCLGPDLQWIALPVLSLTIMCLTFYMT